MCLSAISSVGVRRVVYSALNADANKVAWIAKGVTTEWLNPLLVRGPLDLVPGVRREEGLELLRRVGIAKGQPRRADTA